MQHGCTYESIQVVISVDTCARHLPHMLSPERMGMVPGNHGAVWRMQRARWRADAVVECTSVLSPQGRLSAGYKNSYTHISMWEPTYDVSPL